MKQLVIASPMNTASLFWEINSTLLISVLRFHLTWLSCSALQTRLTENSTARTPAWVSARSFWGSAPRRLAEPATDPRSEGRWETPLLHKHSHTYTDTTTTNTHYTHAHDYVSSHGALTLVSFHTAAVDHIDHTDKYGRYWWLYIQTNCN